MPQELTAKESAIKQRAMTFARQNRTSIAKRLTDPNTYPEEQHPVSVFMAGSPGAGKTEASVALLETIQNDGGAVLRIDPDELRTELPGYDGSNSWLFQTAVSLLVERIHDRALKQRQSFILDGTLSSYDVAEKNIKRSLKRERLVQILYVYQDPLQAWQFVLAREEQEGRRIRRDNFIDQYFAARESVNRLRKLFKSDIRIDLLVKNNDGSQRSYRNNVDQIDNHIPENYAKSDLEALLSDPHVV